MERIDKILQAEVEIKDKETPEHSLAKAGVASSNLVSRSIHSSIAQLAEHLTFNQGVPRSSRG